MPTESQTDSLKDVPVQIFQKFIQALSDKDLPPELVSRLRKTLIEDEIFTDAALSEAVLDQGQAQ